MATTSLFFAWMLKNEKICLYLSINLTKGKNYYGKLNYEVFRH